MAISIPDPSPIENVWAWIKRKLSNLRISNKKDLVQKVKGLWYNFPSGLRIKLMNSSETRLKHDILAKGGHTKY